MIEAMKQALEALYPISHNSTDDYRGHADKAIASLRKAIQEEALRNVQRIGQEIEQEPVPTIEELEQEIYQNTRNFVSLDVMEWMLKRYYTHPPQRKPLTDEQIDQLVVSELGLDADADTMHDFARAIEAAHGIKE